MSKRVNNRKGKQKTSKQSRRCAYQRELKKSIEFEVGSPSKNGLV